MKRLDRHRDSFHPIGIVINNFVATGQSRLATIHRIVNRQSDKGPRVLSAAAEEIVSDRLRCLDRIQTGKLAIGVCQSLLSSGSRCKPLQIFWLEKIVRTTKQMNIGPRLLLCRNMRDSHHLIDPILIDASVTTIAGQQRHRHTGNPSQQNFVDRFFQHVQTSHAANRINMPTYQNL